jgi:hypothetical protein
MAVGVDPESGSLLVESGAVRLVVDSGEITRCRIVELPAPR